MRPAVAGAALAACALVAACGGPPAPGPWHEEAGYRWRDLPPAGSSSPGFTSMGARGGVEFANTVSDSAALRNRHLMHGSGVAIGDVDGDDLPDVYLARIEGPNALYRNLGGWRFEEVAAASGVALADRPSTGAVFADVDGDGDLDLLVAAMGGRNSLLLNDGTGHFTDATEADGFVAEARGSTTMALADVDGDGDLDLYVANYKAMTMLDSLSPQQRAFDQIVKKIGDRYEVIPELRDNYRTILRNDIRAVSLVQRADPDWFYVNQGGGRFKREPLAGNPRFRDDGGRELDREPDDFGLAARFFDANGDLAPDLYVANDFEDPDQFWINDGRGGFRLIAASALRQTSNSGMAVDVSDVDRDGRPDVFEVDMLANDSRRHRTQLPTHTSIPKVVGDYASRAQWQRNVLLLNRGDGSFAEVASLAGVEASGWSWSAVFVDVDLDGFEDLLVGTGHTWDLMDADTQERLKSTVSGVDWRQERKFYPPLALPNVAFRNRGDLTFEDVSRQWRFGLEDDITHGIAVGDLDRDGDLDVVLNRLNAPALVLRNDAPARRVAVRLRGRAPNTAGVGSLVRVTGGPVEQTKEIASGGLYLAGSEMLASFAAGAADSLAIEVRWRSGARSVVRGVRPGRLYEIDEPDAAAPAPAPRSPDTSLFEDASSRLGHRHVDPPFNDLDRQGLLPWKLSHLGPAVGWADLDGDGDDEAIVGAGAGSRLAIFRNDRGAFRAAPVAGERAALDLTGVAALADPGGVRLLVGQSSYEAANPAEALAAPGVFALRPAGAGFTAVPVVGGDTTSVGPIAAADYDGDGDLDLFVGGRVAPGVYPVPGNSRLFRAEAGAYVLDEANRQVLRGVGLVSAATFTDIDGDGDPDLVLAMDWGPVKVLRNDGGRFTDATAALGLDRWTGLWNGVAVGDFDADGRLDLVATNWGRNTAFAADSARPLWMYFGDYNGDGEVLTVLARLDPRLGVVAPLPTLARLAAAMPSVRRRTPTFAAFADAGIDRVLGRVSRGGRVSVRTLDHMVFLNRGDRFEARVLPIEAQLAPAFGVAVADFDGDGAQDLFLAQNFSATDIATPRFDAGRGALLLGDGSGGFRGIPERQSGIRMPEDQRGAAAGDFDGDGRVDLLVGRTAAPTALWRNRGATPGLRVRLDGGGVGARVRAARGDALGPAYELHAGGGYWSQDSYELVLGGAVDAVVVTWPGGVEQRVPVAAGQRQLTVRRSGVAATAPPGSR